MTVTPKTETEQNKVGKLKNKYIHGAYRKYIEHSNIDEEATNKWLTTARMFDETEVYMVAIQDCVIKTWNYSKYV